MVLLCCSFLCWRADFPVWGWLLTGFSFAIAVALLLFFVCRLQKPKIFWGKIDKIGEDWKRVPQKGTGAFGKLPMSTAEVCELLVSVVNESSSDTYVFFCPSRYGNLLKEGEMVLHHSLLPYPALLSNPTKCICMHCGTMQASENQACISCQADLYNLFTTRKE